MFALLLENLRIRWAEYRDTRTFWQQLDGLWKK